MALESDIRYFSPRHSDHGSSEKLQLEAAQLLGIPGAGRHRTTSSGTLETSSASKRDSLPTSPNTTVKRELPNPAKEPALQKKELPQNSREPVAQNKEVPLKINDNEYKIQSGDTLSSIARRMLKLRGEATTSRNIYDEVNRIIDLNSQKLPWLEKNPHKIRVGMKIDVWDRDTGPDPSCRWKDWKDAEPGRITVAQKCESIFAGRDTRVVVAPGGRAVFTEGSQGFVAPRGFARSLTGSRVMAVGGDLIDDGGELQILHQEAKVKVEKTRPKEQVMTVAMNTTESVWPAWNGEYPEP